MHKVITTLIIFCILFYFCNPVFTDQVSERMTDENELTTSDIFSADSGFESFSMVEALCEGNDMFSTLSQNNMPVYHEKDVITYFISEAIDASDTIPDVPIPERSWPDSHRIRRELTPEIAIKYPNGKFIHRKVKNTTWGIGEHLTYSVDYGFYRAGTATMAVTGTEQVNGSMSYHIESTAHSNKFISRFYKVRDKVSSYIDKDGIFSRRFEKSLREGNYESDRFIDFYQDRLIALNTVQKYAITEIPLYVQDILSSLYILRTFDLQVGKDEVIDVYADGKVYPLKVIVHKIETIEVPAGKFECFVVEPMLKSEGIFRQKGRLMVWFSNDEHKIPVKMTSKVIIGNIGTNLEKFSLGEI